MTESRRPFPVRVDATLDPTTSRALWLVKWLLLIPHFIVLGLLWLAFWVLSVVAFFAILFTARYPRVLFDFNVGVLRWSWRVFYYGYGALGTDRYPPFTLAEVPDYPAHLDVPYPERLSRGLVLVKWWLLAIPHYIVLGVFIGGGAWLGTRHGNSSWAWGWGAGGLVGLLVLIAAVVLLFTGGYPRTLYDFVLGMDRWALRVAAYAGLMTDVYPPFRLDMGGTDPGTAPAEPGPPPPAVPPATAGTPARPASAWTGGKVVSVVIGAVLLFVGTGSLVAGGGFLWADRTQRESGYVMSPAGTVSTDSYAVTSSSFRLEGAGLDWSVDRVIGTARVEARPVSGGSPVFLGVAPTADVDRYLAGVRYRELRGVGPWWNGSASPWVGAEHVGGAPAVPPAQAGIWTAAASGPGTQVLTWRPSAGNWTIVLMRADGTAGITAVLRAGATLPGLGWIAGGLMIFGIVLLAIGALLVALAVARAQRPPADGAPGQGTPPPGPGSSGTGPSPEMTGGRTG